MKITIGTSEAGDVQMDVNKLLATRAFIQANSGGGKSYLLRRLFEQLMGSHQVIIIDPEGEFASLREKHDLLLVGREGEIAADPRSAGMLARKIAEMNISAVLDIYDLKPPERRRYVRLFLESLLEIPKALYHPIFIGIDETHFFCPEKSSGEAESTAAVIDLLALGRKRGMCGILATQRLSKLHKDAEAECNNVFIGRTVQDIDQERGGRVLGFKSNDRLQLRDMKPGEFFAFGPAILAPGIVRMQGGKVETSHPTAGHHHQVKAPKASDAVKDLAAALADLPKQAEEEAKTLADAKRQITELQRQLRAGAARVGGEAGGKLKTVEIASKAQELTIRNLRKGLQEAMTTITKLSEHPADAPAVDAEQIKKAVEAATGQIVKIIEADLNKRNAAWVRLKREAAASVTRLAAILGTDPETVRPNAVGGPNSSPPPRTPARLPGAPAQVPEAAAEWFRPAHQRLLNALAWLESTGGSTWRREVVAAVAGVSPSSSSFTNDLSRLSAGQLVRYPTSGFIELTDSGRTAAEVPESPATLAALHDAWRKCPALRPAHVRILDALIAQHPEPISREDLAEAAGVSPTSSSFTNDLSRLSSIGLAKYPSKGQVAAGDILFPKGLQ